MTGPAAANAESRWSTQSREYFAAHAIDLRIVDRLTKRFGSISERGGSLVFTVRGSTGTFERVRRFDGEGPAKVLQPRGKPLELWYPCGSPEFSQSMLLVEGESDALAALSALTFSPIKSMLANFAIAALPGTSFPVKRVVDEVCRVEAGYVFTAFDGDAAGEKLTRKLGPALTGAGVKVAPLSLPAGKDLSDVLAGIEPERRGEAFADLLLDAESARLG